MMYYNNCRMFLFLVEISFDLVILMAIFIFLIEKFPPKEFLVNIEVLTLIQTALMYVL